MEGIHHRRHTALDERSTSNVDRPAPSSNTGESYQMVVILSGLVILIVALLLTLYFTSTPEACVLTNVSQRDFDHYYGLVNLDNPLSHRNAEQAESINSKCHLFYDHMRLFTVGALSFPKSMIVQALRGSGKTQIRQCIIHRTPQNNRILINMYGADINNYLKTFVTNIDIVPELPHEKITKYWTKEHFLQVILTEIASRFTTETYLSILKAKRDTIPLQTRIEVANLLSFYSTKNSPALCRMVNLLLHELTECRILDCSIPCFELQDSNADAGMFIALSEKHRKVKVKHQTPTSDACFRFLIATSKKTGSVPLFLLDRSYRDQVASLINFLSTLGITTTVIVDSLDESTYFFNGTEPHLDTLQAFVNSITNDEILHLALGNWGEGMAMTNSFAFYVFIPTISNIPITISWTRPDKIPIVDLKWDELQLINYADYIFDYLRSNSHKQCKSLPDICSLLGGRDLCVDTMKQLRHPRDFHIFYYFLTQHLGIICTQRNPLFIATEEDLQIVLAKTKQNILKE